MTEGAIAVASITKAGPIESVTAASWDIPRSITLNKYWLADAVEVMAADTWLEEDARPALAWLATLVIVSGCAGNPSQDLDPSVSSFLVRDFWPNQTWPRDAAIKMTYGGDETLRCELTYQFIGNFEGLGVHWFHASFSPDGKVGAYGSSGIQSGLRVHHANAFDSHELPGGPPNPTSGAWRASGFLATLPSHSVREDVLLFRGLDPTQGGMALSCPRRPPIFELHLSTSIAALEQVTAKGGTSARACITTCSMGATISLRESTSASLGGTVADFFFLHFQGAEGRVSLAGPAGTTAWDLQSTSHPDFIRQSGEAGRYDLSADLRKIHTASAPGSYLGLLIGWDNVTTAAEASSRP